MSHVQVLSRISIAVDNRDKLLMANLDYLNIHTPELESRAARLFTNTVHVNRDGEMIVRTDRLSVNFGYMQGFKFEQINDEYSKIVDFPPVAQVAEVRGETLCYKHLLILLQDHRVMLIDTYHPSGVIMSIPPMSRLYVHGVNKFLSDHNNNLYLIPKSIEEIVNVSQITAIEEACRSPLLMRVEVSTNTGFIDKKLIIIVDGKLSVFNNENDEVRLIGSIQLDCTIKVLHRSMLITTDNRVGKINVDTTVITIEWLAQLKYPARSIAQGRYLTYILGDDNIIRQYLTFANGKGEITRYSGYYKRFIEVGNYQIMCAEDLNGKLKFLDSMNDVDFSCKLINLDEM